MDHVAGSPSADGLAKPEVATQKSYFPAVQGMRGFAALSVLFIHLHEMAKHAHFLPQFSGTLETAWSTLGQGVPLFFIISGFVIPGSLLRHKNLQRFFVDRILRIMPLFVVLHLLVFTIGPFIGYKWLRGIGFGRYLEVFFTNLTFTALPLRLPIAQQNSWTLTYEWAFYLLIGATWLAFRHRRTRVATLPILAAIAVASCYLFPVCLYFAIGMLFARFPRTIRFHPIAEAILVPSSVAIFFYVAQSVSLFLAAIPAIIIFLAVLQDTSYTARLLKTSPMQHLGLISYSLYLVHPIAIFPFQMLGLSLVHRGIDPRIFFLPFLIVGTATSYAASIVGYNLGEVRLRKYLAHIFKADRWEKTERLATAASSS